MNIRWLWFDYVPKGITLTKEQRRLVKKRTGKQAQRFLTLAIVPMFVGTFAIQWFDARYLKWAYPYLSGLATGVVIFASYAAIGWVFARPTVFRALREAFVNVCPKCGYDLRGQSEDRCPECGWDAGDEASS